jgi:hypothetical protein
MRADDGRPMPLLASGGGRHHVAAASAGVDDLSRELVRDRVLAASSAAKLP